MMTSTECNFVSSCQILLCDCIAGVEGLLPSLCANSPPSARWTSGSVCKNRHCSFYSHPDCGCTGACCHWCHSFHAEERAQNAVSECWFTCCCDPVVETVVSLAQCVQLPYSGSTGDCDHLACQLVPVFLYMPASKCWSYLA